MESRQSADLKGSGGVWCPCVELDAGVTGAVGDDSGEVVFWCERDFGEGEEWVFGGLWCGRGKDIVADVVGERRVPREGLGEVYEEL